MNYDNEFLDCVERWINNSDDCDDRIYHAFDAFNNLFEKINDNQRTITIKLLRNFNYYNHESVSKIVASLSQKVRKEFSFDDDNSIVSIVRKKDGRVSSSVEYTTIHQNVGAFSSKIHYQDLTEITPEQWSHIDNILLIDDFSGSGNTITNYLKKCDKIFKQKKIVIILVEVMRGALESIRKYADNNQLDIEVVPYQIKDKAFKNEADNTIKGFEELSELLMIPSYLIKGQYETESLVAFFNNTPNNTLGMFWYDTNNNNSLFPRKHDKKPSWQIMKKEKEKREYSHYESKCK